jgi:tetratricopeptide (TPR) repeat protein
MRRPLVLVSLITLGLAVTNAPSAKDTAVWFEDLGHYHRGITTSSPEAQKWFDQGFTLYFGFNHEEAIHSFQRAAELAPDCAMAYWGIAISAGPNINNPEMDEAMSKLAYEMSQKALDMSSSGVERDLIEALSRRYVWPAPEDRTEQNQAYADAMREVWARHPEDADVGTLFAEALMDLRPWDLWTPDGKPQPGAIEIMELLETVMSISPMHPGANHFYIHTVEASPNPEKAEASADLLRDLVPGAGHLVHMPGHIDLRLGRYDNAVVANQKGIEADLAYVEATGRGGFYTLYRAHNYHFLAYAAMFDGRRELALKAARDMIDQIPLELVRIYPDFLDAFLSVPIHVLVRFGLWEELLEEEKPPADLYGTAAFWHYGRTVALSALGRVEEAEKEWEMLQTAAAEVPESRLWGNNPLSDVMKIGLLMAEGELEYRRGNHERAFELLREGVKRDDALRYDEPWGWMQPVRHALGALLVEQKLFEEAEAAYRRDLELHPQNGWALLGLEECLRNRGENKEADATRTAFLKSWERSDVVIKASCYCAGMGE